MHKPEYVLENKTHKIHWEFKIQTDNSIPARRPNLAVINKKKKKKKRKKDTEKKLPSCVFCRWGGPQSENKRKRKY